MQPTQRFKKTLLAGAITLGTGITFSASADLFTVSAEAIADVIVTPVVGTQISFGTSVIGNRVGFNCTLPGLSHVSEADLLFDVGFNATNANSANVVTSVPIGGTGACVVGSTGEIIVIEIDGADASTVQVAVPNVTGTGWVYSPTAESCVVDFGAATDDAGDTCVTLDTNLVTGVGMSAAQPNGANTLITGDEIPETATGYADIVGKTRMVLAGSLTLNADLGQGTVVSDNILVQVTYE
jgi:hypothetical protein